ncbi:papain family cysteine protease (macronuclear) [Tetrahymena thermophila SB210]|uniref:Papain family cysteine protease n=1 Tax=Tetrahymena thermophila (strain SB210) TaxID=312017 RepID=Q23FQ0_TETTS|nr:papain family cysteine protease [Tetrahymena thermophila SB210]EAR95560.1 papain family cysteine protease [Tetrahymena thermophila SB210]|eukprot:XP_001015805.1 papain family cysteine protease [Tetrahymena thermophila SB210]
MSKLLIAVLLCLAIITPTVLCDDSQQNISVQDLLAYNKWRQKHQRVYLNEDEQLYRQLVFFENLAKINSHASNTEATFTVSLNQFSDYTQEEFKHRILNKKLGQRSTPREAVAEQPHLLGASIATSIDWRTKPNVLNPVKDQGQCGSCWTFGAAGVMESFNAIKNGVLKKFSEQQLVDCVHQAGYVSDGCNGGFQEDGVNYAIKYGIVQSSSYPYTGVGGRCKITSPTSPSVGFYPKSFQKVAQTSSALKAALNLYPVTVSVDASNWSSYSGGIFNNCGPTTDQDLNHAVIAVGYDAQGNWIIRNSWSAYWGENGYIRLAPGNTCGVLLDNLYVTA